MSNNNDNNPEDPFFWYLVAAKTVDALFTAKEQELPDETARGVLGLNGPKAKELYGALKMLRIHGRLSRTMVEQALTQQEYPKYIQLWIRSLPPKQRSKVSASLYNSQFQGVQWEGDAKQKIFLRRLARGGSDGRKPPQPLGDHRHMGQRALVAKLAFDFFQLFRCGALFDGPPGDVDAPVSELLNEVAYHNNEDDNSDDSEDDSFDENEFSLFLQSWGDVFGIDTSKISYGIRADPQKGCSVAEYILRSWNALYFANRLSITELEHALLHGTIKEFFQHALHLSIRVGYDGKPFAQLGRDYFLKAHFMLESDAPMLAVHFRQLRQEDYAELAVLDECDFCGTPMERGLPQKRCSACKTALYCSRECQKKDWKRHKPLCPLYSFAQNNSQNDYLKGFRGKWPSST